MTELYAKIESELYKLERVSEISMSACQSMGYNGFKRMHRVDAKDLYCKRIALACDIFDKYQEKISLSSNAVLYSAASIKDHLVKWNHALEECLTALGDLNRQHFEQAGIENCIVKDVICLAVKRREKAKRWWKRFEETSWSTHDMHYVDDHIHEKFKEIEGN